MSPNPLYLSHYLCSDELAGSVAEMLEGCIDIGWNSWLVDSEVNSFDNVCMVGS